MDHNPATMFLNMPIRFGVARLGRYKFDFPRLAVKEHTITLHNLFPGLIFELHRSEKGGPSGLHISYSAPKYPPIRSNALSRFSIVVA